MLDYLREPAMLTARASGMAGMAIVRVLFFCPGTLPAFAGEGKGYGHMKQQRYVLKIAKEYLAWDGYVTNISGTAVAR